MGDGRRGLLTRPLMDSLRLVTSPRLRRPSLVGRAPRDPTARELACLALNLSRLSSAWRSRFFSACRSCSSMLPSGWGISLCPCRPR